MIELSQKSPLGYFERAQTEIAQIEYDAAINDLNKALELKGDEGLCTFEEGEQAGNAGERHGEPGL